MKSEVEQFLLEIREYLEDRSDADFQGDPGDYVPNKEMQLLVQLNKIEEHINNALMVLK